MSATVVDVRPALPELDSDLDHWTECHDNDRTLCGLDASDMTEVDFDTASCVVCEDLRDQPCGCAPDCWCGCEGDE